MVGVSADGTIKLFNAIGSVHLIVDVVARVHAARRRSTTTRPAGCSRSTPRSASSTPARAAGRSAARHQRERDFAPSTRSMPAGSRSRALVMNVTATQATAATYLTLYPSGTPRPNASNLNVPPGEDVPNLAVGRDLLDRRSSSRCYNDGRIGELHLRHAPPLVLGCTARLGGSSRRTRAYSVSACRW